MEFVLGGIAACGAGFFTNPLEVAKTRMQLQGELKARGKYTVHYKNVVHAFYTIARVDGILALQKGLVPALWYQLFMNGCRFGTYQTFVNSGFTTDENGKVSLPRCVVAGALSACIGAVVVSPISMVKIHLQSMASDEIAVGHQHHHRCMTHALMGTFNQYGFRGLFHGVSGAIPRAMVGSASQLATFSTAKEYVTNLTIFAENSHLVPLTASMMSGMVMVVCMTPFDVVSTRLYNQPVDAKGKGIIYRNVFDCFIKVLGSEGVWGFYKGWGASLFRLGPHTVLSLSFWSVIRTYYNKLKFENDTSE